MQKARGLPVTVNANALLDRFCNGDRRTAHVTDTGEEFFDLSFDPNVAMGCPFRLDLRYAEIRERVAQFARAYKAAGIGVDIAFADWDSARRCAYCRRNIPDIDDFPSFQKSVREIRSRMQRETYAEVLKSAFPVILVGNYGVYPNDGYRYWYDYYEKNVEGAPCRSDHRARYRGWQQEFPLTGYTMAMPVVYPWKPFRWHDFPSADFRWFYALLLAASNAPKSSPPGLPLVPFVHWHTVEVPGCEDAGAVQMSERAWRELLWHMLLRGYGTFFLWCTREETLAEVKIVHEVYAASMQYAELLEKGTPVTFEVPAEQGPVISGIRLGNSLLVRRTDFSAKRPEASLRIGSLAITVPARDGECQLLEVP